MIIVSVKDFFKMNVFHKFFGGIFSRTLMVQSTIVIFLVALFVTFQVKEIYLKFQKGKRFTYYQGYVNEINESADELELSQMKASHKVTQLIRILKISQLKYATEPEKSNNNSIQNRTNNI